MERRNRKKGMSVTPRNWLLKAFTLALKHFFKVYCNRRKAPAARIIYNRLRQLPEKESNRFLRGKLRSMRASLLRKHGVVSWGVPSLRTLRHRHSQARRMWNRPRFPPQLMQRVLHPPAAPPLRVGLPYTWGYCRPIFNNHYFILTSYYLISSWSMWRNEIVSSAKVTYLCHYFNGLFIGTHKKL